MTSDAVAALLRHRRLRRKISVKLVWLYVGPTLDDVRPMPVKVGRTAAKLGIKRRTMRAALRFLTANQYLDCVVPASAGTPGEYVLGSRALRLPLDEPRRHVIAPRPPRDIAQIALFQLTSETIDECTTA